ncbi:MAG: hypothetical protein GC164_11840 [Phycisphaera sp.]|nr:hypothetical protein [Phycisphaera sp.]
MNISTPQPSGIFSRTRCLMLLTAMLTLILAHPYATANEGSEQEKVTVTVLRFRGNTVGVDTVAFKNLGMDNPSVAVYPERDPDKQPVMTPELEQLVLKQVKDLPVENSTKIVVKHNLPIFKDHPDGSMDIAIRSNLKGKSYYRVVFEPGDGPIAPEFAALLTTLLRVEGHLGQDEPLETE